MKLLNASSLEQCWTDLFLPDEARADIPHQPYEYPNLSTSRADLNVGNQVLHDIKIQRKVFETRFLS